MGRSPCCVRRGTWSAEEDAVLKSYMEANGTAANWIALPEKIGLNRCGKSCRLRWLNYLRPNIKRGDYSEEEDKIILQLYYTIGTRRSVIAKQLQGRTYNDIQNFWNTKLQRKLIGKQKKPCKCRIFETDDYIIPIESSNSNSTNFTITNGHLMSSKRTYHTPSLRSTRPPLNMISFASTRASSKQQHPIINHVGSSSSLLENSAVATSE